MNAFSRTLRPSRTRRLGLAGAGTGAAFAAAASSAQAAVVLAPTAVVSNSMGEYGPATPITDVIDQSGLSTSYITGVTDYATYLLTSPTHSTAGEKTGTWVSGGPDPTGSIVFDLGDAYAIERVALWQGGPSLSIDRGINSITLETSMDPAFGILNSVGSYTVPEDAGVGAWPVNDFDLTDSVGRYVRLTINSNHGHPNLARFGEIAFGGSVVPEPSIPLLLGPALALVLLKRRR